MLDTNHFAFSGLDGASLNQGGMMKRNTGDVLYCGRGPHSPNCPYWKGFQNYSSQTAGCPEKWENKRDE